MIPRTRPNFGLIDLLRAAFGGRGEGQHTQTAADLLSSYFQQPVAALTPSGRAAQYLILKALPEETVLVPAFTCSAVVEAARLAGKDIIFIDGRPGAFNLTPEDIAPFLQPGRILIATHQFGQSCAMPELARMCEARGVTLVEDIAAALGARVSGRLAGTFGRAAFGSFDTSKLVHAPLKGGFVLTDDQELASGCNKVLEDEFATMPIAVKAKLLLLSTILVLVTRRPFYGLFHLLNFQLRGRHTAEDGELSPTRTEHYLYRFSDWQAGIANQQLSRLEELVVRRRELYDAYRSGLAQCSSFALPPPDEASEWACVRFAVRTDGDKMDYYRRAVEEGVDMGFSFTTIACPDSMTNAWSIADTVLNLPFYDGLSAHELDQVVTRLKRLESSNA